MRTHRPSRDGRRPATPATASRSIGGRAGVGRPAASACAPAFAKATSHDEVRARLASGAYHDPAMAEALARRLVDGGEP